MIILREGTGTSFNINTWIIFTNKPFGLQKLGLHYLSSGGQRSFFQCSKCILWSRRSKCIIRLLAVEICSAPEMIRRPKMIHTQSEKTGINPAEKYGVNSIFTTTQVQLTLTLKMTSRTGCRNIRLRPNVEFLMR